eukprot:m51a1_g2570 hypothetical protein (398) ;mRNA; r:374422-376228
MEEPYSAVRQPLVARPRTARLVSRDEHHKVNVVRRGITGARVWMVLSDPFHALMDLTWWKLALVVMSVYGFMHFGFGLLYFIEVDGNRAAITNIADNSTSSALVYLRCVFFSYTNTIVLIEVFIVVVYTAILAGFSYAKISRPTRLSRNIVFSDVAVVNRVVPYFKESVRDYSTDRDVPRLVIQAMNTRKAQLCEPSCRLYLLRREFVPTPLPSSRSTSPAIAIKSDVCEPMVPLSVAASSLEQSDPPAPAPGQYVWRMHELCYEISQMKGRMRATYMAAPYMMLPLTIVHAMDATSPLYGATPQSLAESRAEIIVILDAVDEACSCTVQARWSYLPHEIEWGAVFEQIVYENSEGFEVDASRLSSWVREDGTLRKRAPGISESSSDGAILRTLNHM